MFHGISLSIIDVCLYLSQNMGVYWSPDKSSQIPATQMDLIPCMYSQYEDKLSRIHWSQGFDMILAFQLTMAY